jgi:hypothetical protein
MGGWMDGRESLVKDCLQQSNIYFNKRWKLNLVTHLISNFCLVGYRKWLNWNCRFGKSTYSVTCKTRPVSYRFQSCRKLFIIIKLLKQIGGWVSESVGGCKCCFMNCTKQSTRLVSYRYQGCSRGLLPPNTKFKEHSTKIQLHTLFFQKAGYKTLSNPCTNCKENCD